MCILKDRLTDHVKVGQYRLCKSKYRLTDHVKVGQGAEGAPVDGAGLDSLDPQIVGQKYAEDGDTLIVLGPYH